MYRFEMCGNHILSSDYEICYTKCFLLSPTGVPKKRHLNDGKSLWLW